MINKFNVLLLCAFLLISCTPLKRGMDGNTYVSTAQPAFSVSVPELALRTSGRFNASVTTSNSLSGISVDTWIAVYGGKSIDQPMAIVAHSSLKMPYYWDSTLTKLNSVNHAKASFGNFTFQACTYLINNLAKDGFAPLAFDMSLLENDEQGEQPLWIVRRFATRMDYDKGKITLEYREKAPSNLVDLKALPIGAKSFIEGFEERALKAFVFGETASSSQNIHTEYPKYIQTRYLNRNFFGTISYHDPYD